MTPRRRRGRRGGGRPEDGAAGAEGRRSRGDGHEDGRARAAEQRHGAGDRAERGGSEQAGSAPGRGATPDVPSRLSYGVAAASGALVLALAVYLVARAFAPGAPATLSAAIAETEARSSPGGWILPVDVRNGGDAPAKEILVEAEARRTGAAEPVLASTTIDYLAGGEEQRIYVVFQSDPRGASIVARVRSWQEP